MEMGARGPVSGIGAGALPTQNEWGTKQKIETYGYNFHSLWHTKCSIIFTTTKTWCTLAIITRK